MTTEAIKELIEQKKKIDEAINELNRDAKRQAVAEVRKFMKERGVELKDLKTRAPWKTPAVTHVNPENSSQTWNGRGRRPKWMAAPSAIAA